MCNVKGVAERTGNHHLNLQLPWTELCSEPLLIVQLYFTVSVHYHWTSHHWRQTADSINKKKFS